jgi:hypothetical protein
MKKYTAIITIIALISILALGASALAANGYNLNWWTVDGGGGTSSNASYILSGGIGQPDASPIFSGGNYRLEGGFWVKNTQQTFLPLIKR